MAESSENKGSTRAFVSGVGRLAHKIATDFDARWAYFSVQKVVRNPSARRAFGKAEARFKPKSNALSLDDTTSRHYEALDQRGKTGDMRLLTDVQVSEMYNFLVKQEWHDYQRPALGKFTVENVPAETPIAYAPLETLVQTPHLLEFASNPQVLAVLEKYFGCKPRVEVMSAAWSPPRNDGAQESQKYHRDTDGMQFIKLFLHLTDVTEDSGPHSFVIGSHRTNRLTKPGFFTDDEVAEAYGRDAVETVVGPRGTCYLENTFGVHKGTKPVSKPRMFLQVLYTVHPTIYPPKQPLLTRSELDAALADRCDPYIFGKFIA